MRVRRVARAEVAGLEPRLGVAPQALDHVGDRDLDALRRFGAQPLDRALYCSFLQQPPGRRVCTARAVPRLDRGLAVALALGHRARERVLLRRPAATFGYEDVTGLSWIEIDFPDDVRRAEEEVLPRVEGVRV